MNQAARHAIVTCLTAILLLALLHGQRLAEEMEEKGLPPAFSSLVRSASDLSPARILEAMRWTANGLASLDRRPGQNHDGDSGQPDQGSLIADSNVSGATPGPDQKAPAESDKLPDSQPAIAKSEPSQIPAMAISHSLSIMAGQNLRLAASHKPFVPGSAQGPSDSQDSMAEKTARMAENIAGGGQAQASGLAENTAGTSAETAESAKSGKSGKRKSIFEHPLSRRYKVLLVGDSFMEDITLALMRILY